MDENQYWLEHDDLGRRERRKALVNQLCKLMVEQGKSEQQITASVGAIFHLAQTSYETDTEVFDMFDRLVVAVSERLTDKNDEAK